MTYVVVITSPLRGFEAIIFEITFKIKYTHGQGKPMESQGILFCKMAGHPVYILTVVKPFL